MTSKERVKSPDHNRPGRNIKLAKIAIGGGLSIAALIGLDSGAEYYLSYRQTGVHQVSNTPENLKSPEYDPLTATVFINGLGRDISDDQAKAMLPVVGNFGRVYYFEYPTSNDTSAMARKIYETIFTDKFHDRESHLNIVTSSMGDRFGYGIAKEIEKIEPGMVELLIMNTGPGPLGKDRVKSDGFRTAISQSCPEIVPGNIVMAGIELVNQIGQGKSYDSLDKVSQTAAEAFEMNGRVIAMQMCELNRRIDLEPEMEKVAKHIIYMLPENAANDQIVDTVASADDWRKIFPNIEIVPIPGVGHDHISYRPELFNPYFETLFTRQRLEREMAEYISKNPRIRK